MTSFDVIPLDSTVEEVISMAVTNTILDFKPSTNN